MATITLTPGTLAPPACYPTEQHRFDAYVAAILATITGGLQWEVGASPPTDNTLYWLRTDANNRPLEALKWSTTDGAWVRWLSELNNTATPGGVSNAYTLTNAPSALAPAAIAYRPGTVYVFRATIANTGACTLAVDGHPPVAIKKRVTVDLQADDIMVGQVVIVVHDGANFQLLSPEKIRGIREAATYAEGNSSTPGGPAPGDITVTVTKPSGATWKEFNLNACLQWRANTSNVELKCVMTFESGTITGTNVTTKPGCGNSPQEMLGSGIDDDSNTAPWQRLGPMPPEYASLNTVSFKVHLDVISGSFQLPSTLYAWIRATYDEPLP